MLHVAIIMIPALSQCTWNVSIMLTIILWSRPSLILPNMFRLLGCYAILNLQNVSQVVHHISNINLYFQLKHTPQIIILIVFATCCHHYDHCPVPMYLKCSDYFVFISTNEILDIQMSHRQLLWFVTYLNCICYVSQVVHHISNINLLFPLKHTPQIVGSI